MIKVELIEEYSSNNGLDKFKNRIKEHLKEMQILGNYDIHYSTTTTDRGILYSALIITV